MNLRSVTVQVTVWVEFAMTFAVLLFPVLVMILLQGFGGGATHVSMVYFSAIKVSHISQVLLFTFFKPAQPVLESFKWQQVNNSAWRRIIQKGYAEFPSLQGGLCLQPQTCESVMFLMGTAILDNVAELCRRYFSKEVM